MLGVRTRIGAVLVTVACTPTVDLGSNVGSTGLGSGGLGSTSSGVGTTTGTGTATGPGTGSGIGGTTSGTGTTSGSGTGSDAGSDSGSDSGSDTGSDSGSDTSTQSCRDAFPAGLPCLTCAELECCDEIDLCLGQPECDCFLLCVTAGTPPLVCEAMCDPSSGAAAVSTCLSQACTFDCSA